MNKKEQNIIFSLDTKPLIKGRWGYSNKFEDTIIMTALSLLYTHLWYDNVILYTDELGYKIFEDFPIKIELLENEGVEGIWMRSKIEAIEKQKEPFIHIDTDVFIKKKINFSRYSNVIVERKEIDGFNKHYKEQIEWFDTYLKGDCLWTPNLDYSLNCGIIGFNDIQLKDKYIEQYYKVENIFINNIEKFSYLKEKWYEPCIVIEQYNLNSFLETQNIFPNLLLEGDNLKEQIDSANLVGYVHLYGKSKYEKDNKDKIIVNLIKYFPHWYNNLQYKLLKYYNK